MHLYAPCMLKCCMYHVLFQGCIPLPHTLREFVCLPPPRTERLHCTMVRHGDDNSGGHYTLYLEYLGGLIPLLKGKRASKLRPEFIIFDPKIKLATSKNGEETYYVTCNLVTPDPPVVHML